MSELNNSTITLTTNYFEYAWHVVVFLGLSFLVLGVFTFVWPVDAWLFSTISTILGVIFLSLLIFVLFIVNRSTDLVNNTPNQQYPDDLDYLNTDHDALIIVHSMGIHGIGQYAGIDNLIIRFISENYPFKIYHCYNRDDVISVLRNEHAKFLWIFAHGWRGGVAFKCGGHVLDRTLLKPKATELIYNNLGKLSPPLPIKRFIAQLHCNPISKITTDNVSSPAILMDNPNENDYYVTDGNLNHYAVWFATRQLALKIQRIPIATVETGSESSLK